MTEVVEKTLSDTPCNTSEALLSAVIDERIHLDCLYFLLRREPDVLMKLLSTTTESDDEKSSNINKDGNFDKNVNHHAVKDDAKTKADPRKRKRS